PRLTFHQDWDLPERRVRIPLLWTGFAYRGPRKHSRGDGLSSPSFVGRFIAFSALKYALMGFAPSLHRSRSSQPHRRLIAHTGIESQLCQEEYLLAYRQWCLRRGEFVRAA